MTLLTVRAAAGRLGVGYSTLKRAAGRAAQDCFGLSCPRTRDRRGLFECSNSWMSCK
jgi:hypothetical protein